MHARIIDRDHQVERGDLRGRTVEIAQPVGLRPIVQHRAELAPHCASSAAQSPYCRFTNAMPGMRKSGSPLCERRRATATRCRVLSAAPGHADHQSGPQALEAFPPLTHLRGVGNQIAGVPRERLETRAQQSRQTAGGDLCIPWRHAGRPRINLPGPGKECRRRKRPRKQSQQPRFALDEAAARAHDHLAETRGEHHLVADSLLAVDQNRAVRIVRAAPFRLAEDPRLAVVPPAPFVLAPAALEVALSQQRQGPIELDDRRIGLQPQRSSEGRLRLGEVPESS